MKFFRRFQGLSGIAVLVAGLAVTGTAQAIKPRSDSALSGEMKCQAVHAGVREGEAGFARTICADVVALDQTLVYNRFGSYNPFGMIFALRRDVVRADEPIRRIDADACDEDDGTAAYTGRLVPGQVRLRDCKRPRPLVLRANVGDVLHLRLTNLLRPLAPRFSQNFCGRSGNPSDSAYKVLRKAVSESADASLVDHGEAQCRQADAAPAKDNSPGPAQPQEEENPHDWPAARGLNFGVQGLTAFAPAGKQVERACLGLEAIPTGEWVDCYYKILREGPYFVASTAAPAGGEGDGGSITHGLFGAVVAEKEGTSWYRSQVSRRALAKATPKNGGGYPDYAASSHGKPLLNLLLPAGKDTYRLFHNELNAIIDTPPRPDQPGSAFREFSVFFHDELKAFFTRNFDELGDFGEGQLAGVRDGFAINYGASGMGALLLANRKGIGPAANCAECFYEEFFLSSWANGDPALLEQFSDDPSNVHHSYLNDAVVFRNVHAGPKETHVFHLHAHQWFAGNDSNRGAYLDSQTVGPQQAFSYDISGGGLSVFHRGGAGEKGWWETLGSGNRNRTPGDSIFHCHLYPHFAQGMWELWRVHDVYEDGTRKLPDGQWQPGLTLQEEAAATRLKARPGSVDAKTGRRIALAGGGRASQLGTPIPAMVPLRYQALPLAPSYPKDNASLDPVSGKVSAATIAEVKTFPGYPFYIAGAAGHRPPQAPLDIARQRNGDQLTDAYLDGGLPRHVLGDGSRRAPVSLPALANPPTAREQAQKRLIARALALGDMRAEMHTADVALLPYAGTPLERAAMAFHHNGKLDNGTPLALRTVAGAAAFYDPARSGYVPVGQAGAGLFPVNGAPPKPGAPFADPCGAPDALAQAPAGGGAARPYPGLIRETDPLYNAQFTSDPGVIGFRRYEASAVQLDLVTNRAGWHDPQARINVLSTDADKYKSGNGKISPRVSAAEQPFFFRALSGECIEFRHTNELPKELELDDFQVRTPTDTIGQHIHLVKFDVTASDGSGNGWNYEDGTFAPDEIAARICAAKGGKVEGGGIVSQRGAGVLAIRERASLCELRDGVWHASAAYEDIWRRKRGDGDNIELFQTTVQRWFADPILSAQRHEDDNAAGAGKRVDRTLRTVFSHDHFGPSSIQQHGFYTALLIEPAASSTCKVGSDLAAQDCTPYRSDRRLLTAGPADVGARKIIRMPRPPSPAVTGTPPPEPPGDTATLDAREFALAIADFATLYDPRDSQTEEALRKRLLPPGPGETKERASLRGMALLACEAEYAAQPQKLKDICDSGMIEDGSSWHAKPGNVVPAWLAAGRPDDKPAHQIAGDASLSVSKKQADKLLAHLIGYRRMAAGHAHDDSDGRLASPVAPPQRPESISVDHHDPYLFNYFGEPLPLRVGAASSCQEGCKLKPLQHWVSALATGVTEQCSIDLQRSGQVTVAGKAFASGDMSNVFASHVHGDPVTPILETRDRDTVQLRLIQGAQEVQHTFTVEDHLLQRNQDQRFPSAMKRLDDITPPDTLVRECATIPLHAGGAPFAASGRADQYHQWYESGTDSFGAPGDQTFWRAYDKRVARCFNSEGRIAAQEVGISEHFEFTSAFLYDSNFSAAAKFSLDGAQLRMMLETPQSRAPEKDDEVCRAEPDDIGTIPADVSDTLVHFGSVDALWNGAWGLLRVHKDPLAQQPQAEEARQVALCDPDEPRVYAAVAAIEARELPGAAATGIRYAPELDDPQGLFFAVLDPRRVMNKAPQGKTFGEWVVDPRAWTDISLATLKDEIVRTYVQPEPMALTVKAGECLNLTVLNAMTADGGYLRDGVGDARMPPIVPLNVGLDWQDTEGALGKNRPVTFTAAGEAVLKPSARLSVSLPLPVLQKQSALPRPVGASTSGALLPVHAGKLSMNLAQPDQGQIVQMEIYAGIAVSSRDAQEIGQLAVEALMRSGAAVTRDLATLAQGLQAAQAPVIQQALNSAGNKSLRITRRAGAPRGMPEAYVVTEAGGAANQRREVDRALPALIDALSAEQQTKLSTSLGKQYRDRAAPLHQELVAVSATPAFSCAFEKQVRNAGVNFIPYAYGAIPFKSHGDVIAHATRGLSGAIVVVPKDAALDNGRLERVLLPQSDAAAKPDCKGQEYVIAPAATAAPLSVATMTVPRYGADATRDSSGDGHRIRQFTLFWQDGLSLADARTRDRHRQGTVDHKLVADCLVCDDSYDWGEKGVSYRSAPFNRRLLPPAGRSIESHYNFNEFDFGKDFFALAAGERSQPPMHVLRAEAGEEVVIHVVHPGGRARQRAFVTLAQDYDDLFPGFGFPRAALLGPGKAITASLTRALESGCYLWFDGPTPLRAGGAWGLLDVVPRDSLADAAVTSCAKRLP
jgi:manganese oxidase